MPCSTATATAMEIELGAVGEAARSGVRVDGGACVGVIGGIAAREADNPTTPDRMAIRHTFILFSYRCIY